MSEFDTYVDVDVDDFVSACNKKEISELIDVLVEDGHLPQSVLSNDELKRGAMEVPFIEKMDQLRENITVFHKKMKKL